MSVPLHIIKIDSKKMTLSDNSEWLFWPGAEPRSPWEVDDKVERGTEGKFSIEFINLDKQKQKAGAYLVDTSGGVIGKGFKIYPRENLDKNWRIKELYDDGSLLLEDGSEWQPADFTTTKGVSEWNMGQYSCISEGSSGMSGFYRMKNLKIEKPPFIIVKFLGFRE